MGTSVKFLEQVNREIVATFHDGSVGNFDLVVVADGLHSDTRAILCKDGDYSYRKTGWCDWVSRGDLPPSDGQDSYTEYWGNHRFVGLYPVRNRVGIFVGGPVGTMQQFGYRRVLESSISHFKATDSQVWKNLEEIKDVANPFFWEFDDCRAKSWVKGRVVLLRDAASGFLPTAGIGASMAMESAAVLNDELARTGSQQLERAHSNYVQRRQKRVEAAQDSSRKMGTMMFVGSAPFAWFRNQVIKHYSLEKFVKSIAGLFNKPI